MNEKIFDFSSVTGDNIKAISECQSLDCERRICELSELCASVADTAETLFSDGLGIYEILGLLSERLTDSGSFAHSFALLENAARLGAYFSLLNSYDRALFAELFCEKLEGRGVRVCEKDFLPTDSEDGSIVYVRNRLADEAYDVFSAELDSPTVSYVSSFKDAARAVSEGSAEYCLLPLEERGGARLAGTSSLIFAEELKINSVTPVFGFDGSADMKYALISKHFTVPTEEEGDDRYLEIRLPADVGITLSELFAASGTLGVSVYRINTLYFDSGEGDMPYYSIVFRNRGSNFSRLLVFLTLFCSSYTAVGIYKNLE